MRCAPVPLACVALAGCGGADKPRRAADATPAPRPGELAPTQADAERLRPLIERWARRVYDGDAEGAADLFTLPALVANPRPLKLVERAQIVAFNATLPCGARVLEIQHDGRYVVATFRLTDRPGSACDGPGGLARVAFVIRGGRINEWRRVPDGRGAPPGPTGPMPAPTPTPELPSGAREV